MNKLRFARTALAAGGLAAALVGTPSVGAVTRGPTYCHSMPDSTSTYRRHFWLYVNCDTSSARYTASVVARGPNDYRRVLYRGTPPQDYAFIDRWIRVPYRGWYTVVILDYDPARGSIPDHYGLDRNRVYVY